jgi:hypothetical protein
MFTFTFGEPKLIVLSAYELAASSETAVWDPLILQLPRSEFQACPLSAIPKPDEVDALLKASCILDANHCFHCPPTFMKAPVAVFHDPETLTERPVVVLQIPLTLD